jgi:hypothetical protein
MESRASARQDAHALTNLREDTDVTRPTAAAAWAFIALPAALWATLALYFSPLPGPASTRTAAAAGFALGVLVIVVTVRPWRRTGVAVAAAITAVIVWFLLIPASNDRDWQPDVAILPWAEIEGDRIVLHNVRHNEYRTETDYTVRHDDRTVRLSALRTLDVFLVHWGSPAIAHTILSFGFADDRYVAISIETRKEKGEDYSAVRGFFRQYEITYVVADERDVVRLRSNLRGEDVYLYRLHVPVQAVRALFVSYLRYVNRLRDRPVWYNAVTHNCTTAIRGHRPPARPRLLTGWKVLLNGYLDELAYEQGLLDRSLPFAELKARSLINATARSADRDPAFSARIRAGLPGMRDEGAERTQRRLPVS